MTDKKTPEGEDRDATRDARGRWRKGHCPNPKGRPRKPSFKGYDQSDIRLFANTQIEITANGRVEKMDRRTAMLNKVYESAMKGSVTAQRFLYIEFMKSDDKVATAATRLNQLVAEWYGAGNGDRQRKGIPSRVQWEIWQLAGYLNHYFPGQYAHLLPGEDE